MVRLALSTVAVAALVLTSCSATQGNPAGAPATALASDEASATGSAAPAAPPVASPSPPASPGPTLDCRGIAPGVCERAVAVARAAHEADVRGATTIVVDDDCASLPRGCGHPKPFDAIVAFIAGHDTTGWYAYEVTGPEASTPTTAGSLNLGVPDAIAQRLATPAPPPAPTASPPPPGPTVDGVELGTLFECPTGGCAIIDAVATAWLDRVAPGHAPVASIGRYGYPVRDTNGDLHPTLSGAGPTYALVLTLADGAERATLVECGPTDCWQADPYRVDPPAAP
jgi:hypothetical protein